MNTNHTLIIFMATIGFMPFKQSSGHEENILASMKVKSADIKAGDFDNLSIVQMSICDS